MKRPGAARGGGGQGGGNHGEGTNAQQNQQQMKKKKTIQTNNVLGNILGNIKKTTSGSNTSNTNTVAVRSSLMTPQERALERRKTFEKDVKEKIENEVTTKWEASGGAETATFSFQPMVKMWRDVLHECASEMQTTSESIEIEDVMDENGDPMKFVRVYKLSKKEEEEKKQLEISLREKAEKAKREMLAFRKKESLTDKAPAFGDALSELRVAREGEKRDKRSVEETIADMRKAKEG